MILDTAFFLDLIDGDTDAVERATRLEAEGVPQRVPAQVVYELYIGVGYTATSEDEAATLAGVLASRPIVETTAAIAKRAGRLEGELRRAGTPVPTSDCLIGATALSYDEPVVTRDADRFERLPGVEIAAY